MKTIVILRKKNALKSLREKEFASKIEAMKYIKTIKIKPDEVVFGNYRGGGKLGGKCFFTSLGKKSLWIGEVKHNIKTVKKKAKKATGVGSTPRKRKTVKKKVTGRPKTKGVGSTTTKRKTAKKRVTKKPVLTAEHKKHIASLAGKLINEGLTASTYTKMKARKATLDVVAPVYVRMLITNFSPLIKKEMASIRRVKKAKGVGSTPRKRKPATKAKKRAVGSKKHKVSKPIGATKARKKAKAKKTK